MIEDPNDIVKMPAPDGSGNVIEVVNKKRVKKTKAEKMSPVEGGFEFAGIREGFTDDPAEIQTTYRDPETGTVRSDANLKSGKFLSDVYKQDGAAHDAF